MAKPPHHQKSDMKRKNMKTRWFRKGDVFINDDGKIDFTPKGILMLIESINRRSHPSRRVNDRLANRVSFSRKISEMTESNKVAIVHGGRDCDGVEVNGLVEILPATITHVEKFLTKIFEWAEGPTWWEFETPSQAEKIERSQRDRVMEAHENGHAWSI